MNKVAVVYWSGTGNTEAMADAVVEGAKNGGAEVDVFTPDTFNAAMINDYEGIIFGCPAMGAEVLEEEEFEPMFADCEAGLKDKKVALFGSYGWGDGEWMRTWEERCNEDSAVVVCESVMCNETPDDGALEECRTLGADFVTK